MKKKKNEEGVSYKSAEGGERRRRGGGGIVWEKKEDTIDILFFVKWSVVKGSWGATKPIKFILVMPE